MESYPQTKSEGIEGDVNCRWVRRKSSTRDWYDLKNTLVYQLFFREIQFWFYKLWAHVKNLITVPITVPFFPRTLIPYVDTLDCTYPLSSYIDTLCWYLELYIPSNGTVKFFVFSFLYFPRDKCLHVRLVFKVFPHVALACKGRFRFHPRVVRLFTQIRFIIED